MAVLQINHCTMELYFSVVSLIPVAMSRMQVCCCITDRWRMLVCFYFSKQKRPTSLSSSAFLSPRKIFLTDLLDPLFLLLQPSLHLILLWCVSLPSSLPVNSFIIIFLLSFSLALFLAHTHTHPHTHNTTLSCTLLPLSQVFCERIGIGSEFPANDWS